MAQTLLPPAAQTPDLTGLTLSAALAALGETPVQIRETTPPLGAKSPLRGATDEGVQRVLRARWRDGVWELLVAREQTRA